MQSEIVNSMRVVSMDVPRSKTGLDAANNADKVSSSSINQSLDYNILLAMIVFKCAEVPTWKLIQLNCSGIFFSLLTSVFDSIGLFNPFSVHI